MHVIIAGESGDIVKSTFTVDVVLHGAAANRVIELGATHAGDVDQQIVFGRPRNARSSRPATRGQAHVCTRGASSEIQHVALVIRGTEIWRIAVDALKAGAGPGIEL